MATAGHSAGGAMMCVAGIVHVPSIVRGEKQDQVQFLTLHLRQMLMLYLKYISVSERLRKALRGSSRSLR